MHEIIENNEKKTHKLKGIPVEIFIYFYQIEFLFLSISNREVEKNPLAI